MKTTTIQKMKKMSNEGDISQVGGTHYTRNIQPWDLIINRNYPWCVGEILKYLCRHSLKGGKQDLQKAISIANKANSSGFKWHPLFEDYPSDEFLFQFKDIYPEGSLVYFIIAIQKCFGNDWVGVVQAINQIIIILYEQEAPASN